LYSLAGFPYRRERVANADVDPGNVYVPGLHDVGVGAERAAPWTKKIVDIGVPTSQIGLFNPVGP
jgi:hypothetical protein